jgi:ABC-type Fe3+-hydroxamate transport system substrate-binding protein
MLWRHGNLRISGPRVLYSPYMGFKAFFQKAFILVPVCPWMRILSLHPAVTELVFALGAGNMLVGRCDACTYPEAALSVPSIGNAAEVTSDKIAIFEPELVLIGPGQEFLFPMWQTVRIAPESIDQIYSSITSLGSLLGKHVEADMIVHDLEGLFDKVKAKSARFRPVTAGVWNTPTKYVPDLIACCVAQVRPVESQPHLVVVFGAEAQQDLFVQQHKDLKAVQNERVFLLDPQLFYATPRLVDGMKQLAKILHGIEINGG